MELPLLQTKFYIPALRIELVSRPRLIKRLNTSLLRHDSFSRKLTLISAPAGFGKTTLVSEWARAVGTLTDTPLIAWLSLDKSDNDLARFLSYFIAALNEIKGTDSHIGKGTMSMVKSPQLPPIETILTPLINEILFLPKRMIFILDDYHLIDAQPIHNALTFLIENLPPQMHLVIVTREDPPLPLARLRALGDLIELRATDLRFTPLETHEFLNQVMNLNLTTENITALEKRTEGWIAGLQLAAISMQGRQDVTGFIQSFTGSHHFVLDYLVEEVFEQQSETMQTFLLHTSILDRLTGPLCDAVRFGVDQTSSSSEIPGQQNSQVILEMLQHANLFIMPLDEKRHWYRYHHLFGDLLRLRLRQVQPEQVLVLHHRASEWYEKNGFINEAIEHTLRAEDFKQAVYLIEQQIDTILVHGEHTKLRRWLDWLPVEVIYSKPHLCIFHAWFMFTGGQQDAAEQCLQAINQVIESSNCCATGMSTIDEKQPSDFDRTELREKVAAIRAFVASFRGDASDIIKHAHHVLEYLPEHDLTWRSTATVALGDAYSFVGDLTAAYQVRLRSLETSKATGNIYMILVASVKLAITMRHQGQLEQAIKKNQQQMQLANENGLSQTAAVGWLLATWGVVLADLNDLDGALHQTVKGVELAERGGDVTILGWSYVCLTMVLFSRENMAGAEEIINKMDIVAQKFTVPPWITNQMAALQARIWLAQNKLDAAFQWARERELPADKEPLYVGGLEYGALARIFLAQGRLDDSLKLLERMLEPAQSGGHTLRVIEILILEALVFQEGDNTQQALSSLEGALALAEPGGFIRIFVDEGPAMVRLLYHALSRGIAPDYIGRLLAAFPAVEAKPTASHKTQFPQSDLIEPLSERELEILQLIAEGLTNAEIAARLYLSQNTVKAHNRNIYGKLSVHNRTQALTRAQDYGLLPRK